jgi:hypothetical protein
MCEQRGYALIADVIGKAGEGRGHSDSKPVLAVYLNIEKRVSGRVQSLLMIFPVMHRIRDFLCIIDGTVIR